MNPEWMNISKRIIEITGNDQNLYIDLRDIRQSWKTCPLTMQRLISKKPCIIGSAYRNNSGMAARGADKYRFHTNRSSD